MMEMDYPHMEEQGSQVQNSKYMYYMEVRIGV